MKKFAAVLLAGGRSKRMKTNKAFLDCNGIPMWRFQIEKLVTLRPNELFFSIQNGMNFPPGHWTFVYDRLADLGPLGGLEAALRETGADFLVTLAVDMPGMTADFLSSLLEDSGPTGLVPLVDGFYCGGAAVYPTKILPVVERILAGSDRSFQHLIHEALENGMMNPRQVPPKQRPLFENWNRPEDQPRGDTTLLGSGDI